MNKKIILVIGSISILCFLGMFWLSSKLHPILKFEVKSEFVAPANGLRRLHIAASHYQKKDRGDLVIRLLSLENNQEEVIQEKKFTDSAIKDSQWLVLEFTPLPNSQGKKFAIELIPVQDEDSIFSTFYQLPQTYLEILSASLGGKIADDPTFFIAYLFLILGTLVWLIKLLLLKKK